MGWNRTPYCTGYIPGSKRHSSLRSVQDNILKLETILKNILLYPTLIFFEVNFGVTCANLSKQETTKDGMAVLQSGNKIWEGWLRTGLNAMFTSSSSSSSGTRSPSIGFAGCIWCYIRRTHWPAIRNWRFYQAVLLWVCLIAPTIFLGAECMTLFNALPPLVFGQSESHKSGNKIWEDPHRTNLNAKVYLHVIYCKNIKWPWTGKVKVRVT